MLISLLLMGIVIARCVGNLLYNGDFENGDLTCWTPSKPAYFTSLWEQMGKRPTPPQVFCDKAPMYVYQIANGGKYLRRIGIADDCKSKSGYSVGWTRAGGPEMGYPFISQILQVAPGKYKVEASWDVVAWHLGLRDRPMAVGGIFMVNVDDRVMEQTTNEIVLRRTTWNHESKGQWIHKEVKDFPIESKTGIVEIRLQMWDHNDEPIPETVYEYVAFDNVVLRLIPIPECVQSER